MGCLETKQIEEQDTRYLQTSNFKDALPWTMWKCVYSDQSPSWKYTEARQWKEERREGEKERKFCYLMTRYFSHTLPYFFLEAEIITNTL